MKKSAFITTVSLLAVLAVFLVSGCVQGIPNPNAGIDRNSYGNGWFFNANEAPKILPIQNAFLNLPEAPADFNEKVSGLMESADYAEFSQRALELDENYYLQPEFLPNFAEIGLQYWKNPDLNHWGVQGVGFFPSDETFEIERGKELTAVTFYHAGWYVQNFQGAKLSVVLPQGAEKFLSAEISPESVLLEPTYPLVESGWIKKIIVKIKASEMLEKGKYEVGIELVQPAPEDQNAWENEFGERYVDVSGQNSLGRQRFRAIVSVK